MGRGRGRGGRGRNGGGRGGDRGRDQGPNQRGSYDHTPTNNDTFEAFYKAQNILTPEEWEQNMESLRTPLPTNFRFTGSKANATKLLELMKKNYFPSVQDIEIDGEKIPPPQNLPWYPNNFGWQYKPTRSAIRSHEGIKKFHEFLMAETECGNVSRQEAVSMIPPLLLDVQPGHYVLDMCAAPGSKTAQLIENVQSNNEVLPAGLVIANDADYKRAFMLVKQSKRLQSPCLIVTNHEAQFLPYIYFTPKGEEPVDGERALQFDRILCDVPCCGDGTLRKNKMIWRSWHQSNGNSLNKIQLAILLRAIHFLKVGGRVVYSTCTFNPVENEAVVAAALNKCGTAIKLLDVSKQLPALKRRPGISNWKVMDPEGTMHDSYDTVPDKYKDKKLYAECFPPANAAELNLERCLRIVPFDQDTGAFFVAVFEKVEPFGGLDKPAAPVGDGTKRKVEETEAEPSDGKRVQLENNEEPAEKKKSAAAWEGKNEEPFVFVSKEHADVTSVVDFYGVKPDFPTDQFVVRSINPVYKTLYLVSSAVKRVLHAENSSRLKIVNTGVKIFTRVRETASSYNFPYRVSAEGVATLAPFLTDKRVVTAAKEDVKLLLEKEYPLITEMSSVFQNSVAGIETGSFIVRFSPDEDGSGSLHEDIVMPILRSPVSCSLLVPKEERKSLMSRVFGAHFAIRTGLDKDEDAAAEAADDVADGDDVAPADDE